MKIRFLLSYFIISLFFISLPLIAQTDYHHPELDWYTIETEHFVIHYHEGAERTARVVANIAEDIYEPVTSLYNWKPDDTIHFIIKDHDDNSNGAAFYYDNKVEIWAPQMTFILRGTHNWLRNVVTHEFSHMISLGASRKMSRNVPAFYFQWINYEREKRPDVLYGYPNQIASYAIPNTIMPMWLAEGMAQFMAPNLDYDRWDTHRDMLIRTAVMNGELHSFAEMGVFGKNSIGNERTYNAGYALTRYIADRYGVEALQKLTDEMSKPPRFSVNGAIKSVTGVSAKELYAQWRDHLKHYYQSRLQIISDHRLEGTAITKKGIGNIAPVWSPDSSLIAFCGSRSSDYLSLTSLKIYNTETEKTKTLKGGVNSQLAWSPDGAKILYTRKRRNKYQSKFNDVHVYDLKREKEERLTHNMRIIDPDWSPDGKRIVGVTQQDGTDNLILLNAEGELKRRLTNYNNGEGVYTPRFSPDGKMIVFCKARRHGRDIYLYHLESDSISDVITDNGDARDPVFSPDGHHIYFAWDKTGIFNIYSTDVHGKDLKLWTNVIGGAFMPNVNEKGDLLFSNFQSDGYRVTVIRDANPVDFSISEYSDKAHLAPELNQHINNEKLVQARNYDDTRLEQFDPKPYSMNYGEFSFMPRVMVDSNRVKLGTYFYSGDVLDRFNVFGGFVANTRKDLDAFLIFEYRNWPPTLFAEFYAFTRNVTRNIAIIEDYPRKVPIDIHFRMYEGDFGARYNIAENQTLRAAYVHSRYISDIGDFYFEPQRIEFKSPANTYFYGNHFQLQWNWDHVLPGMKASINPSHGRRVQFRYSYELDKFFEDFSTEDKGVLSRIYSHYNYNKIELDWSEYMGVPFLNDHSMTATIRGGFIDRPVDSFFNFFGGGLPGLRGYPFYSIEGRKMLMGRFTYRLPVFELWQKQFLHLTTDRFYLSAFFDIGNAFNTDKPAFNDFKKDAGVEMRLSLFSFYGFPTAFSLQAAYGFDEHVHENLKYGKEWRYYFTLLFDFMN